MQQQTPWRLLLNKESKRKGSVQFISDIMTICSGFFFWGAVTKIIYQ